MIGIYKITNEVNNKIYIGQSINIEKRVKEHFWKSECSKDRSYNSALHSAIRKYGKQNFSWEIIEECTIDNIDDREKYYIKYYNSLTPNGYNILSGGQKNRRVIKYCKMCNCVISKSSHGLCRKCSSIQQRTVTRPSREELKQLIRTTSFVQIGKQFGVSDKAIVKWCIAENLPSKKSEIKKYSNEQWNEI